MQPGVKARSADNLFSTYTKSPSPQVSVSEPAISAGYIPQEQAEQSRTVQNVERDERGYAVISLDYDDSVVMKDPVIRRAS